MPPWAVSPLPSTLPKDDDDLMSLDFTKPGAFCVVPPPAPAAPTAFERAAQLRADGNFEEACRLLEGAVESGVGEASAWEQLLDLYQAMGRREAFEACALEFARRFEKSPPPWRGTGAPAVPAAAGAGKSVSVSLSGTLNARVQGPLQQVLRVCTRNPVRLDLSRIADADDQGCALLLDALGTCRRCTRVCPLAGAAHFAEVLAARVQPGERANEHIWLLLLEMYQRLGREAEFEEAALNYAITFELSPPSWDAARIGGCDT
jgi:ABC-type transporter Mla MlaB component